MNAAELDRRARTYDGWIPPHLISWLIEHGHLGHVEHEAHNGDWFCAQAWVRILIDQERREEALEVLTPFLATGWWRAACSVAELFEGWGRVDEAIEVFRSNMGAGGLSAVKSFALLLARHGRGDEAFDLAQHPGCGARERAGPVRRAGRLPARRGIPQAAVYTAAPAVRLPAAHVPGGHPVRGHRPGRHPAALAARRGA